MMNKLKVNQVLAFALFVLSGMACSRQTGNATQPTPVPTVTVAPIPPVAPTPPAPPPVPTLPPYDPPAASVPGRSANELEAQIEAAYAKTAPSVVNITRQIISYSFFMQPMPQEGTGSGFVYDTSGHIVTNYRVVQDAQSVVVALVDGTVYTATITGQDPSTDLAVLSIPAQNLPPLWPWRTRAYRAWGSWS
jgi:S1-C subfamily serine protease